MRISLLFNFIVLCYLSQAQGQVLRYQQCTNCPSVSSTMSVPVGGFTYASTVIQMSSPNIASDFGRRASNSLWHLGVDVSSQGADDDVGDRIFPIESGTVIRVKGSGDYKVLVINGTQRYGFGHIFFNEVPNATSGSRSGDFILKEMDAPHAGFYAIIYAPSGGTATAIGEVVGTVRHPDINNNAAITVSTQIVDINVPVAPFGNSGNAVGAAHIHLYNFHHDPDDNDFLSSYPAGFENTNFRNPKNPLQFLTHNAPIYLLTFPDFTNGNIDLTYPGNGRSSLKIRAAMSGEGAGVNYSNSVMDIEDIELFIKRESEPFSAFKLIKGPVLESKISYGGKLNSTRYPSINSPANNSGTTAIDIAKGISGTVDQGIGSATRTGIVPFAYATQPYDEFYFSDIYSRIHKDDNFGGTTARFAGINQDTRYPDGPYDVYARATTVTDQHHNSQFLTMTIDNFRPYIKEVIVRKNGVLGEIAYHGHWDWNSSTSQLSLVEYTGSDIFTTDNIWINIKTSEPVKNLKINIPAADGTYWDIDTSVPNTNSSEFTYLYPLRVATTGTKIINLTAQDFAGNSLQTNPEQIPLRQANSAWTPAPSPGTDSKHHFNVGTFVCANSGSGGGRVATNGRIQSSSCLYADVTSSKTSVQFNEAVTFSPITSGAGTLTYLWNFGDGALPSTSTSSGPQTVLYTTSGSKTVSLKICDNAGTCITETKTGIVTVGIPLSELVVDFSTNRYGANVNEDIQLTSIVTGGVAPFSYSWDFGDDVTKGYFSDVNPLIAYSTSGNKTVRLTVTDATGSSAIKIKTSYLGILSFTYSIEVGIRGCGNTDAIGQASGLYGFVTGGSGPPYQSYSWDFGDGTPIVPTSSSLSQSHKYTKPGKYTVRLKVCDNNTCGVGESIDCIYAPASVGAGTAISVNFLVNDRSIYGPIQEVGLNTPVKFVSATSGGGDPATFRYGWFFDLRYDHTNGTSANPNAANTTGPKAQEVVYSTVGNKQVQLFVNSYATVQQEVLSVVAGRGSGSCYATIGNVTISSTCWTASNKPKFTIPIVADNCPVAKTEVMYWIHEGQGIVMPNGILDFDAVGITPQYPITSDFSFSAFQYDGVSYNRIGYKRQRFTIYGPVTANAGIDKQVCLGSSATLGTASQDGKLFKWSSTTAPLNFLSDLNIATPTFSGVQKGTFLYKLTVTDAMSGCSTSDDVSVTVDRPEASTNIVYAKLSVATPLSGNVSGGFGGNVYLWSPADKLSSASVAAPSFTSTTEGDFNYMVTVTDQQGCSSSGQVFVNASSSPANLIATAEAYSRISLTWIDRSPNETSFVIQRSVDGSAFSDYSTVAANAQTFNDLNVTKESAYTYKVAAKIAGINSGFTNEASVSTNSLPQFSTQPETGAITFADFDNDGDMDYVQLELRAAKFYFNSNDTYTLTQTITTPSWYRTSIADFDNDGDMDVHLIPWIGISELPMLLVNNSSSFQVVNQSNTDDGSPRLGLFDFNLDNDVDLMAMNYGPTEKNYVIRQNNGTNIFTHVDTGIPIQPFLYTNFPETSHFGLADVDNDGDEDFIAPWSSNHELYIYPNSNGFDLINKRKIISNCCDNFGSVEFGDFNNDQRKDFIHLAGPSSAGYSSPIFRNDGNFLFTDINNGTLFQLKSGQARWGDFDSDGDLDLLLGLAPYYLSNNNRVYLNSNGNFSQILSLTSSLPFERWFDYDGDGDLDIIGSVNSDFMGTNPRFTKGQIVYRNNLGTNLNQKNTKPSPPSNLCVYFNDDKATFTWSASTDVETPSAGLTYNLYVKQNGNFVMSPLSDLNTGYRKIQKGGNVDHNTSWTLTIPGSGNLEWGVQAVDNCFIGSAFTTNTVSPIKSICGSITSSTLVNGRDVLVPQNCSPNSTTVSNGATLTLEGANVIRLLPGFKVNAGSFLNTKLTDYTPAQSPCIISSGTNGRIDTEEEGAEKNQEVESFVRIYPNPTTGLFTLEVNFGAPINSVQLDVINLSGVTILTKTYSSESSIQDQIDISGFSSGVYLLRVSREGKIVFKKVIKI